MAKLKIAVLFGGASKDYYASLRSAQALLNALPSEKYDAIPLGITRSGRWLYFPGDFSELENSYWERNPDCCSAIISPDPNHGGIVKILQDGQTSFQRVDVIFSVLHGKYGECGQIQALCKLSGVPFVGSGLDAANACADRMLMHLLLDKAGIKTSRFYYLERTETDNIDEHFEKIEDVLTRPESAYPMYVKAASCSQSIGANLVNNRGELRAAVKIAFTHHHKILIEEPVNGRELECAVYGGTYSHKVSKIGEIISKKENSGFAQSTAEFVPAALDENLETDIIAAAEYIFKVMGCKNMACISFCLTENGLYCRKVRHMPGFDNSSVFAFLMKESGYEYNNIIQELVGKEVDA